MRTCMFFASIGNGGLLLPQTCRWWIGTRDKMKRGKLIFDSWTWMMEEKEKDEQINKRIEITTRERLLREKKKVINKRNH